MHRYNINVRSICQILEKLARQAVECSKGVWMKNMSKCLDDFGWSSMEMGAIRRMSSHEVGEMLKSAAWRKVSDMVSKNMEDKPCKVLHAC